MTIEIIIVHPPDYNEQANLPVVSLLSLREKDGLSMGFKHKIEIQLRVRNSWIRCWWPTMFSIMPDHGDYYSCWYYSTDNRLDAH